MEGIHERLSRLRRERGLSQRQAAADLGLSQAQLSHYETGAREPGLGFLCRACDYYGVTADYLLGRAPFPGNPDYQQLFARLRVLVDEAERQLTNSGGEKL